MSVKIIQEAIYAMVCDVCDKEEVRPGEDKSWVKLNVELRDAYSARQIDICGKCIEFFPKTIIDVVRDMRFEALNRSLRDSGKIG